MAGKKVATHLQFVLRWRTAIGEAEGGVDLAVQVRATQRHDSRGKPLRPIERQLAVQKVQRLDGAGGDIAARTAFMRVRHVEAFEQRIACVAPDEDINTPAI